MKTLKQREREKKENPRPQNTKNKIAVFVSLDEGLLVQGADAVLLVRLSAGPHRLERLQRRQDRATGELKV